jgi:hypothetical protein
LTTDKQHEGLRRMYEAAVGARGGARANAAIPLEKIVALVEGTGSEEERLATLDAVMSDKESAKEFELLRSLAANRPPARPTWMRRPYVLTSLALAATVVIVAIPTIRSTFAPKSAEPVRDVIQGATLLSPPIEATPLTSRKFEWRSVRGARTYVVEILTAAGTQVFATRTADTTMTLPSSVRIEPLTEYRWWVLSELSDGTQRRSAFRRLLVREAK